MTCGSIGCTYHQIKYSFPNLSNKIKRQEPYKRAYFSENGGFGKKNGPKAEKYKTERATGLSRIEEQEER